MILVAGSIALDRIHRSARLPVPGESVAGTAIPALGGLGGVAALAALRAGAETSLAAAVGEDDDARLLRNLLSRHGLHALLAAHRDAPTGSSATILGDDGFFRTTACAANALFEMGPEVERLLGEARLVLAQCEANPRATQRLLAKAREKGLRTLLHAAPFRPEELKVLLPLSDLLLCDAPALAQLAALFPSAGFGDFSVEQLHALSDARLAALCGALFSGDAAVDLGPRGLFVAEKGGAHRLVTGLPGAAGGPCRGEILAGSLAARLDLGDSLRQAARHAVFAADLTGPGTQEDIPHLESVLKAMESARNF